MSSLGKWLDTTRKRHTRFWGVVFLFILACLVAINFFLHPPHAEYHFDEYPGFWAFFGLVVALLMVLVMKKIIYPFITGPEDSYDDK
jgi:uncharacterized ion transporter superfamily protein YfcC